MYPFDHTFNNLECGHTCRLFSLSQSRMESISLTFGEYIHVVSLCWHLFGTFILHSSGEWISGAVCMYIVNYLLTNYGQTSDKAKEVHLYVYTCVSVVIQLANYTCMCVLCVSFNHLAVFPVFGNGVMLVLYILFSLVNPRRACAARVTVLGLCVCLFVCLSVCLLPRFLPPRATNRPKSDTNGFSATLA